MFWLSEIQEIEKELAVCAAERLQGCRKVVKQEKQKHVSG